MKTITNFNIDQSDLAVTSRVRSFTVTGEKDAEFILQVFNAPTGTSDMADFYDFKSNSFSATHTSTSSLNVKMQSDTYTGSITFPANGSGDTYTILLIAPPDKDTELSLGYGKHSFSTTITQLANATLTFTPITANSSSYQTFATTGAANVTSSVSPVFQTSVVKELSWDLKNTLSDANGFGLRLTRQPIDTDWYFTTTETVDGAVAPSDVNSGLKVTVDDLTDLTPGMYITAVSSGSLSGTPVVTAINTTTKTLTISSAQTFADGITLTFQARGSSIINRAIGADINFSNWNSSVVSATSAELTQVVRTDSAGNETLELVDTYGVSGGGFVSISGDSVNNNGDNTIQTVTADAGGGDANGSIVVQLAQANIPQGVKLYFDGSTKTVSINNSFTIVSHPSTNRTIYLNLDNFITPGVSGS